VLRIGPTSCLMGRFIAAHSCGFLRSGAAFAALIAPSSGPYTESGMRYHLTTRSGGLTLVCPRDAVAFTRPKTGLVPCLNPCGAERRSVNGRALAQERDSWRCARSSLNPVNRYPSRRPVPRPAGDSRHPVADTAERCGPWPSRRSRRCVQRSARGVPSCSHGQYWTFNAKMAHTWSSTQLTSISVGYPSGITATFSSVNYEWLGAGGQPFNWYPC
jgi:hypothetical protein